MSIIPQNLTQEKIPSTPGIYAIVNLVNQHVYVGSAVVLAQRKRQHLSDLRKGKHGNGHLQNAYNLYGADAFIFYVIEHIEHVENLILREQHFIDTLNPHYNIARVAGSTLGMKFTDEHKAKLSAAKVGKPSHRRGAKVSSETRAKQSAAKTGKRGRKHSPDTIVKISESNLGRKRSPESRAKMSVAQKGRKPSPRTIESVRAAHLGKPCSLETREKLRDANLGKTLSPEHCAKLSTSHLGKKLSPESIAKREATKRANRLAKQQNQPPLF